MKNLSSPSPHQLWLLTPHGATRTDVLSTATYAVEDRDDIALGKRVHPAELRTEAGRIVRDIAQRVVDLVVERALLGALVGDRDQAHTN